MNAAPGALSFVGERDRGNSTTEDWAMAKDYAGIYEHLNEMAMA